jgi:hypothetical protein
MKQLILILSLTLMNHSLWATNLPQSDIEWAQITQFMIGHDHLNTINDGAIYINHISQTLHLSLYERLDCPPNAVCMPVIPNLAEIDLPLVNSHQDECGQWIYTAQMDGTPYDGLFESLTVYDNSKSYCMDYGYTYATYIEYTSFNPWTNKVESSYFVGEAMQSPFFPLENQIVFAQPTI